MGTVDFSGKKILVVDDEPDLREILKDFLELVGAEVFEADNGVEAFSIVESQKIDAVISDIRMPGGDGMSLASNINQITQEKPKVLLVTGFADTPPLAAYDLGVEGVIYKPFKFETISESLTLAFTKPEVRWSQKIHAVIKDISFQRTLLDAIQNKIIKIGFGGICICGEFPQIRSKDYVRIEFDSEITITGIVRWSHLDANSSSNSGLGIEFINLSPQAILFFKNKIDELKPRAFIPRC